MYFDWNFIVICSQGSNWKCASIGVDNGLAPQTIIWIIDGFVYWRIYIRPLWYKVVPRPTVSSRATCCCTHAQWWPVASIIDIWSDLAAEHICGVGVGFRATCVLLIRCWLNPGICIRIFLQFHLQQLMYTRMNYMLIRYAACICARSVSKEMQCNDSPYLLHNPICFTRTTIVYSFASC